MPASIGTQKVGFLDQSDDEIRIARCLRHAVKMSLSRIVAIEAAHFPFQSSDIRSFDTGERLIEKRSLLLKSPN
ncbi:MAG: hypothetical protein JWM11_2966 [Planctomycetaceae bacterium]|nr:hypothetical protein [Planctomycetaceae bacterium]